MPDHTPHNFRPGMSDSTGVLAVAVQDGDAWHAKSWTARECYDYGTAAGVSCHDDVQDLYEDDHVWFF